MNIKIITVGKIKESFYREMIEDSSRDIRKKTGLEMIEVEDEKTPDNASEKEELQIKDREGERILSHIISSEYVVTLEIKGKKLTRDQFYKISKRCVDLSRREVVFVIGGSLGLSSSVLSRSDHSISFSRLTFPHQMMKAVLLEQIKESLSSDGKFTNA